jgi:hypothetical protein
MGVESTNIGVPADTAQPTYSGTKSHEPVLSYALLVCLVSY